MDGLAKIKLAKQEESQRPEGGVEVIRGIIACTGLLIVIFVTAQAQSTVVAAAAESNTSPKVTEVTGQLEIGREITFKVEHLSDWAAGNDPQKLVPFIDGRPLNGIYPEEINLSANELQFHLRHTPESKKVWTDLFHEPVLRRSVAVSVGLEKGDPFDTVFEDDNPLNFTIIPKAWGIVSVAVILVTLMLFIYLARTTSIVRDRGPRPATGEYRPYNLGRVQMAFWFFLISISYVCLWLVTGDIDTIGPSHLALLGISGATAIGSDLSSRKTVKQLPSADGPASQGLFADLLSDAGGYRFHRFQICAWTLLLGLIFATTVYDDLVMPEFSNTLLLLAGISAGTYLGFTYIEANQRVDEAASILPKDQQITV